MNIICLSPYLSISELRIFGKATGKKPKSVKDFAVNRQEDRRDAQFNWKAVENAQGYNVFWGISPNKLYNTWLVYDKNYLEMKNLVTNQTYYFTIECPLMKMGFLSERTP
jgi:hypothetical protein